MDEGFRREGRGGGGGGGGEVGIGFAGNRSEREEGDFCRGGGAVYL